MAKTAAPIETSSVNLIGNGTEIKGNVNLKNDIRVDGKIIGNIQSAGRVLIGISGEVEGNIYCTIVDVAGNVKGNIEAAEITNLKNTANIHGDVTTAKISIEQGATFVGLCKTIPSVENE